ncbi:hypothetical protein [Lichenicola sp.]|uniref:hypothetical protein n=1 Tax=Lichenicola sp. TaxID=2804529 RepID=UPI003B00B823
MVQIDGAAHSADHHWDPARNFSCERFPVRAASCHARTAGFPAAIAATRSSASSKGAIAGPPARVFARLSIDGAREIQTIGLARPGMLNGNPGVARHIVFLT